MKRGFTVPLLALETQVLFDLIDRQLLNRAP